jgi:hypothetical protein
MQHLSTTNFSGSEEKFAAESNSIDSRGLFGISLDAEGFEAYDQYAANPFAIFLNSLAEEIGADASFDGYGWRDYPFYRVCEQDAALLVGGDKELAEAILEGQVALSEMPKGIGRGEEQALWVRAKVEESRKNFLRAVDLSKADKASS